MIQALFSSLFFYLLPLGTGLFCFSLVQLIRETRNKNQPLYARFEHVVEEKIDLVLHPHTFSLASLFFYITSAFTTGIVVLFLLAVGLQYGVVQLLSLPTFSFPQLFFPLVYLLALSGVVLSLITQKHYFKKLSKARLTQFLPVFLIIFLAIVTSLLWNYRSPYSLNWDLYQHQLMSRVIIEKQFSLTTSSLSDTFGFDSYPPTFHLLMASAQWPFELAPTFITSFWQITAFFHLALIGIASYLLARSLYPNRWVGILSILTGMLIFDSVVSFTNIFLLPQTLAALIFTLAFAHIIAFKPHWLQIAIYLVAIFMLHYVVGTLAVTILLATAVAFRVDSFWSPVTSHFPLLPVFFFLCLVALIGAPQLNLSGLNQGEAALYTYSLSQKWEFALRVYGWLLIIFLPLSAVTIYEAKSKKLAWSSLIFLGLLTIISTQLPYMLKFYVITRFFLHFFLALGIWSIVKTLDLRISKAIAIILVILTCVGLFGYNISFWKHGLNYQDQLTHLDQSDLDTAEFLQKVYADQEILMISDPATQFILEGFSGVNSPGGSFMTPVNRNLLFQALSQEDSTQIKSRLDQMTDKLSTQYDKKLFVVSGRTFLWKTSDEKFRNSFDYNIWSPRDLSWRDKEFIEKLDQSADFSIVFSSPVYTVLEF